MRRPIKELCRLAAIWYAGVGIMLSCSSVIADTNLSDFSIEELMQLDVTLVSRKAKSLQKTSAAVYIITNDDIRHSGVTSVAEALRLAPGVHVARIDANKWAISIRGNNGRFASHVLVQIDGRTVYSQLFAGVYWDAQDVMLEDIEQIEVVRGPGGTMWGANAVNGVINIVTKSARDTQGSLLSTSIGTEYEYGVSARHGAALGENAWLRVYAKSEAYDSSRKTDGSDAYDDWNRTQTGFKMDWEPKASDKVTIQGDYYESDLRQVVYVSSLDPFGITAVAEEPTTEGGNLLARWSHNFSDEHNFALQFYYDHFDRQEFLYGEKQDTIDIDLQHSFALGDHQTLTWGGGYRIIEEDIRSSDSIIFHNTDPRRDLISLFLQDEISLLGDRLHMAAGTKVEHNTWTGVEWQPSVRMTYSTTDRSAVWAAVSHAVKIPANAERIMDMVQVYPSDFFGPGSPPLAGMLIHSDDFKSENIIAYEIGYRANVSSVLSMDIAAFVNEYDDLRTVELTNISPEGFLTAELGNGMRGDSYGVELSSRWQVLDWWRLIATWTYTHMDFDLKGSSDDIFGNEYATQNVPGNIASLFSNMQLPGRVEVDGWVRYVDSIYGGEVPAYTTLDLRLGWNATDNIELSLVGQGLLHRSIQEYGMDNLVMTEVTEMERSIYCRATIRF